MKSRIVMLMPVALCLLLALPAQAQWKWRDQNGRVQYSDRPPPPGIAEGNILQRPGAHAEFTPVAAAAPAAAASAASGVAPVPKTVEPELEAKRRKAEEEKAAKDKAEEQRLAAARADNCVRARAQLGTLDSGVRIARTNASGEREILDDSGRAEERRRTMEIIASDCK